jgi:DnaK suppressor protein
MALSKSSAKTQAHSFSPYKLKKGEKYMNDQQLAHFKNILLEWKKQLMEEVDSTVDHLKEPNAYADPLDRASQEEGFNLELRTRDRERKLIRKIEQVMDRIANHDYGYCEDCGAEIGLRRLEARPTATKCIDCKTFEEIREKQAGGE